MLHDLDLVPDVAARQQAAHADTLGGLGHGVVVEGGTGLDEHRKAMPQHLQAGELRARMLVFGGDIRLPVGEGNLRRIDLRQIEDAAAGGMDDMVVGIDETGMDGAAAGVKNAPRPPGIGDLVCGSDGDDPAPSDGDGAAFEDAPLLVDGDDVAVGDDEYRSGLLAAALSSTVACYPPAPVLHGAMMRPCRGSSSRSAASTVSTLREIKDVTRVLLAGLYHETNTFAPEVTDTARFTIRRGAELSGLRRRRLAD